MHVPLLDLKAQYAPIREEIRAAMDAVCESQFFILGPTVEAFEKRMADYSGVTHAVGVSSGSDALLVALMALGVGPGDAVLTTPYSFFATTGSIVRLGATPLFADIDPVTFNIDPARARHTLENIPSRFRHLRLKAMIPVHLYGQAAPMDPLRELAAEFGLHVIEDAAQAIGVEYPSAAGAQRAGSMSEVGCFSFFPSKNLGGFGDGGLVTTDDDALAERMRRLRNHGAHPKYYHGLLGGNFRLDALQAAVLNVKLNHLESWHEARRAHARRYDAAFAGSPVVTPAAVYAGHGLRNYHIYNQYVIRTPNRDRVRDRLRDADVGCEIYYPVPLHLQPCFENLGYVAGDYPISEQAAAESLALPIYAELTDAMQDYVAKTILEGV